MPHFDRGVYEPNDELRVFDGAEDDDDVEGSRLPLLIVLALLVLAMFAGVVWLAYTQGVARGRTETPVLTAQNGPARIAPQNPGGAEQPYKGFKIYEQPAPPDDAVDTSTPATTAAAPAAAPVAVTPPAPAPKPAPVAAVPKPAPPPPVAIAKVAAPVVPAAKIAPAPVAKVVPPPMAAAKVAAPPAPGKVAAAAPAPVVAAAALAPAKPVPAAASPAPATSATGAPRSLALAPKPVAAPAPAAPVASAPAAPAAAGGAYVLQIGAYKSQAEAATAWQTYKAKHAALLAGTSDDIQQADLADKGVWYRLRITGFPSKDVASALCDRLKADGGGCFLGK